MTGQRRFGGEVGSEDGSGGWGRQARLLDVWLGGREEWERPWSGSARCGAEWVRRRRR